MPKYLLTANYAAAGTKGLAKVGGTARRAAAAKAIKSLGGKLEVFYYAFGKYDAFLIADLPDNASMAALSIAINSTGAVDLTTTPLLTAEEIDAAIKKTAKYQPPAS
jgi:uncharacterized protein with GYD domain